MRLFTSKILVKFSVIFLATLSLISCGEVFEEDISEDKVMLTSPADSAHTFVSNTQFVWEKVNDAFEYQIQIVKPNFDDPINFEIDSTLQEQSVFVSLNSGIYEWRIRAKNGSSETQWTKRMLTVQTDSTGSIDGEILNIVSPSNNVFTWADSIIFEWDLIDDANYYTFDLFENNDGELGAWTGNTGFSNSSSISVALDEGAWYYHIEGHTIGGTSSSEFSEQNITIDRSPPSQPSLIAPLDVTVFFDEIVNFSWESGVDELSSTSDSLFIYNDESMIEGRDSLDVVNENVDVIIETYPNGEYYWKIKTTDFLGFSSTSSLGTFTVTD